VSTIRTDGYSRRTFLRVAGGALGGAWLTLDLTKVAQAAHDAHVAQQSPGTPTTSFLSKAELADVDAISAQIIPTDDTPGAREAGVALFIDRALATFFGTFAVSSRRFVCVASRSIPRRDRLRRSRMSSRSSFSSRWSVRRSSSACAC